MKKDMDRRKKGIKLAAMGLLALVLAVGCGREMSVGSEAVVEGEMAAGNEVVVESETATGNGQTVEKEGAVGSEQNGEGKIATEGQTSDKDGVQNNTEGTQLVDSGSISGEKEHSPQKLSNDIKVKGIYITGPKAGSASFQDLLTLVDETELNAMVIDVKNDEGNITWKMELESAQEIGACTPYIRDMEAFMKTLKEHEVYTIARIVCFKDPYLAAGRPELALVKPDGTPVTDANGMAWVNPYKQEVWDYLIEVAQAAAEMGFDEIQFDYVRFPIGSDADAADYGVDMQTYTKQQAISEFLDYAVTRLHDKDIIVTADVFGTIIGSETDVERVGQDYAKLGETIDVLCPMVYPSHYGNHVFGIEVPDAKPYDTVLAALEGSKEELAGISEERRATVRPWLQAFTASWVSGHISYGGEQIRQQIQAVYDAGYEEWILWNAVNRYTEDGLMIDEEKSLTEETVTKEESHDN